MNSYSSMESEDFFVNVNDYTLMEGDFNETGGFGQVFVVIENNSQQKYAVKELDAKAYLQPKAQKLLQREVTILNQLHHIAIVKFRGFSFISFRDPSKWQPTIFTEFVDNNSLGKMLTDARRGLSPHEWNDTKKCINLIGIASALKYLHENEILHRDLKPDNILLDHDMYPKVCDFGLSRCLKETMTHNIGTQEYMAPEILTGEPYGLKVDVFSYAILAFEIVTGCQIYPDIEEFSFKILNKIVNGTLRPKFPEDVNANMKALIEKCWDSDPAVRPSFDEIFLKLSVNYKDFFENVDESEINKYLGLLADCAAEVYPENFHQMRVNEVENEHYKEVFQYCFTDDKNTKSPLCYACSKNYIEIVQFLLTQSGNDVNMRNVFFLVFSF